MENEECETNMVDGSGFYEAESILQKRIYGRQVYYLVKWSNYPM